MVTHGAVEVATTREPNRWNEILEEIGDYQMYHLPEFHRLAEMQGQGQAILPVYRSGSYVIAFPMLLRDIALPLMPTEHYKDATSVAGFVGPLASCEIPKDVIRDFQRTLQDFLKQHKVISVYNRLNPLMNQVPLLEGYGELVEVGVTLSLDLTVPSEEQLSRYRKGHLSEIKRLRRDGFICEEAGTECLDEFIRIYYDTMDRVNADKAYYFKKPYFEYLMHEMEDVFHVMICKKDGIIISVEMFGACGGVIEGYLSGTSSEYVQYAPSKLVTDEIREWGKRAGAGTYHLGGGVGAQRDALYSYKAGFGPNEHSYFTWRHVVDQKIYTDLCREVYKNIEIKADDSYFPVYRHPSLQPVAPQDEAVGGIRR